MILLSIVMLTAIGGSVGTWYLTGGADPMGGNPVAAVLVGFAVALLWSRGFTALERAFLMGDFAQVRHKLRFWGKSIEASDLVLLQLFMATEGQEDHEVERCLSAGRPYGLTLFVKTWAFASQARIGGDPAKAIAALSAGADAAQGLDRAELLCELGVALLQQRTGLGPGGAQDTLRRAIRASGEADQILQGLKPVRGQRRRMQHIMLLQELLRGMVTLAQGRDTEALRRLNSTASRARLAHLLRTRRLAVLCRIEAIPALYATHGELAVQKEVGAIRRTTKLSMLLLRLSEIEEQLARSTRSGQDATAETPGLLFEVPSAGGTIVAGEESEEDSPQPGENDLIRLEPALAGMDSLSGLTLAEPNSADNTVASGPGTSPGQKQPSLDQLSLQLLQDE